MSRFYAKGHTNEATMDEIGISLDVEKAHDVIPQRQEMINLRWTNVCYKTCGIKGEKKTIIHTMSGHAEPGEMLAIMGTSGAGKSTLLDILSGRLISSNLSGQILANDRPIDFSSFRKQAAYVNQSDSLFPHLTVKETLHYAAHLGIHGKTYAEREAAADKTMHLLRLGHAENTIIGNTLNRGLSGGEKRRVSIAVDIIHEPRIIFLDEPTSGLDSATAITVVEALKGIAVTQNATLVVTIHQPSARLYAMFNKCLFLAGGKVTYTGPSSGLHDYATLIYQKANLGIPVAANAPEVFLELCDSLKSSKRLDLVIINTESDAHKVDYLSADVSDTLSTANSCCYEVYLLIQRSLRNTYRTRVLFFARLGSAVAFGFLVGSLFYKLPETDRGIKDRVGYLLFSIAFFFYTSLEALPVFLAEKDIFQREYGRGAYRAISYVTATSLVIIPFLFVLSLALIIPSYWLVMLPNEAETFAFHLLTLLCTDIAGQSFAILVSVIVPDQNAGLGLGSCLFSFMYLFSGRLPTQRNIPIWWKWLHYMSLFKYSYESMIINSMENKIETPTRTNQEIMMSYSVDGVSKWRGIGVLLAFSLCCRFLIYKLLVKYHNGRRKD